MFGKLPHSIDTPKCPGTYIAGEGLGLGVKGLGCRVEGLHLEFTIQGLGFGVRVSFFEFNCINSLYLGLNGAFVQVHSVNLNVARLFTNVPLSRPALPNL